MPTYLVERRLPELGASHRAALARVLHEACQRLDSQARAITYLGTVVVPARALCLCLFEAPDALVVRALNEAALVPFVSITEAIRLPRPETAP